MSVDLHLHTVASDGLDQPDELVDRVFAAGIRVMSVTDHDTRAAEPIARDAATRLGMHFISGIEVTSVHQGKDVHVLAYGLPHDVAELDQLLADQRRRRIERAQEIGDRLNGLRAPIDISVLIENAGARGGKAIARPQIAAALVAAGHVSSVAEAFERFLGDCSPAYVPHRGASPAEVVSLIASSGGVASLAHPGLLNRDELIPELIDAGLKCIEAYHSAHSDHIRAHYVSLGERYGLGLTGGSDFHGVGSRRAEFLGRCVLPSESLERLMDLLALASGASAHQPAKSTEFNQETMG